jgi:hypothetical protein
LILGVLFLRSKLTPQKLRRIREKDDRKKREKRTLNEEKEKKKIPNQADIPENSLYTPSAQRKAVSRAKKSLPKNPKKFAVVIENVVNTATPRKRTELSTRNVVMTPTKKKKNDMTRNTFTAIKNISKTR